MNHTPPPLLMAHIISVVVRKTKKEMKKCEELYKICVWLLCNCIYATYIKLNNNQICVSGQLHFNMMRILFVIRDHFTMAIQRKTVAKI